MITIRVYFGLFLTLFLIACMGPPHPRHAILVDLSKSNANYDAVVNVIDEILKENGLRNAGRGGYDTLTNGARILDYTGSDELLVSVGPYDSIEPSEARLLMIDFTQGGKHISLESHQFIERIKERLEVQWPHSVSEWQPARSLN